jgi:hypothetical protein
LKSAHVGKPFAENSMGETTVRNVGSAILAFSVLILTLATNSFAAPHVMRASAVPEPGVLVALGGGLVGLATVIRRRFSR